MTYYVLIYEYDNVELAKTFTIESELKKTYLNLIEPSTTNKRLIKIYQILSDSDTLVVLEPYLDDQFQLRLREKGSDF